MTKNATPKKNATSRSERVNARGMSDLPATNETQHNDHHNEQHRKHEQRDGGTMRHVAGNDAGLKTRKSQDRGCSYWTAHSQQKDNGKIGEREHDAEDQADGHDWQDHRQDNLVVATPEAGAIDRGGIDNVLRNRGDAGEEDHNGKWKEAPGVDDDHT